VPDYVKRMRASTTASRINYQLVEESFDISVPSLICHCILTYTHDSFPTITLFLPSILSYHIYVFPCGLIAKQISAPFTSLSPPFLPLSLSTSPYLYSVCVITDDTIKEHHVIQMQMQKLYHIYKFNHKNKNIRCSYAPVIRQTLTQETVLCNCSTDPSLLSKHASK
jgi:hypothetical protein